MSHIYFTDRDLGKRFPEILADAGLRVERHHDLFPADGSDEQWLARLSPGRILKRRVSGLKLRMACLLREMVSSPLMPFTPLPVTADFLSRGGYGTL